MKLTEKKIRSKCIYHGQILDFYLDDILLANKLKSTREYSKHVFATAAVIKVGNKYLLEKQYRYPLHRSIIEIPAGKSNKGETPKEAVAREILEETGYRIKNIKSLGLYHPAPAYSNEIIYLFFVNAYPKPIARHLDKDEAINLVFYTRAQLLKMIKDNKITDSKTIVALLKHFILL